MDGFTKALLERFWSLRHVKNLLMDKLCATVLTSLDQNTLASVNLSLAIELEKMKRMQLIGQLTVQGNIPCATCRKGDACEMSGFARRFGLDARTCDYTYSRVED